MSHNQLAKKTSSKIKSYDNAFGQSVNNLRNESHNQPFPVATWRRIINKKNNNSNRKKKKKKKKKKKNRNLQHSSGEREISKEV